MFYKIYFSDGTTLNSDEKILYQAIILMQFMIKPFDYLEKFRFVLVNNNNNYLVYEKDTSLRYYIANTNGLVSWCGEC